MNPNNFLLSLYLSKGVATFAPEVIPGEPEWESLFKTIKFEETINVGETFPTTGFEVYPIEDPFLYIVESVHCWSDKMCRLSWFTDQDVSKEVRPIHFILGWRDIPVFPVRIAGKHLQLKIENLDTINPADVYVEFDGILITKEAFDRLVFFSGVFTEGSYYPIRGTNDKLTALYELLATTSSVTLTEEQCESIEGARWDEVNKRCILPPVEEVVAKVCPVGRETPKPVARKKEKIKVTKRF